MSDEESLTVKCPPVDSESYSIAQEPPQSLLDPVELQSGLGGLSLGPQAPCKPATPSLFEPRIYQTPNLFNLPDLCSSPLSMDEGMGGNWGPHRRKPLLSPARLHLNKLTHSSWVAGGYWQNNHFPTYIPPSSFYCNQNSFSPNFPLSRSSSQSSGFASQGGTNYSSLPNSRTGSVCDADRFSVLSEPIYPSYAPPLASYCCYVTAPPSGPAFYFPPPPSPPSHLMAPAEDFSSSENEGKNTQPPKIRSRTSAPQKTLLAVIKENFFLATLFFSSLVFNAVVIALAAMNTFQVLN